MKRKKLMWIFVCFALHFFTAHAIAAPVPDTGQTTCYDVAGNVITCTSPGQPLYGQDANYSINTMSYTKLDNSGNLLPDSATSWSMVKDNVTGLTWEIKNNMDGVSDYSNPHDADNIYTWYDPTDPNPGTPGSGTDTKSFIDALNSAHFGGFSDWRLPTIKELVYIVNYSISLPGPTINTGFFSNTQASIYWSSTTYSVNAYVAWAVYFNDGSDSNSSKNNNAFVRAVRGGQSGLLGGYTDNGNGTVTDTSTGLMWQQAAPNNTMNWEEALSYCATLNLGNNTDWRLPTIKELRSLVDYDVRTPAINTIYFPNTISSFYWSSTTYSYSTYGAWDVNFEDGNDRNQFKNDSHVRAVRGGQANSTPNIKANGQNGQITVSFGTPVSITAGLAPGNENGILADWWLAASTPWGWYSLNSDGWTPGINLLVQYHLVSIFPPVAIYSSALPVGDYAFYFLVDMSTNGIIDSPFYYDVVQVHVVN